MKITNLVKLLSEAMRNERCRNRKMHNAVPTAEEHNGRGGGGEGGISMAGRRAAKRAEKRFVSTIFFRIKVIQLSRLAVR